ncbi:MAG: hypothetical protein ACOX6H_01245 [Christensenellales bacterium]|jgi:hypothetical protein
MKSSYYGKASSLKFSLLSFVRKNKLKLIILAAISVLALVTGVFSAIKYLNGETAIIFSDFGLKELASGNSGTSAMFFQRLWSILAVLTLLMLLSLHAVLFGIGTIVVVYRSFLLGLNVTFIIILYGFSGIITGILIIFPFQLLMLCLMIEFFVLARDRCVTKSKYGAKTGINLFLLFLIFLCVLAIVNLLETILLVLTSAKVILII